MALLRAPGDALNAPAYKLSPDEPLLYSKGYKARAPVDEVAPQHMVVHGRLLRWGIWSRSRTSGRGLASIEGLYTKGGTPPSTAPMQADPAIVAIERAVLFLPMQHRYTIRWVYVWGESNYTVCARLHMRYEGFGAWMFAARAMVVNLLRRHGAE